MAEPNKQYTGDGSDNLAQGAKNIGQAAKQFGQQAAQQAATAGAEATAAAAGSAVAAGAQSGAAVANVAAGTAAGGPVGAALAAAWSLRHTIFKVIVCIALLLTFLIAAVVSLPSIVVNNVFRTDPDSVDPDAPTEIGAIYDDLAIAISDSVAAGYEAALARVEELILDSGTDADISREAVIDYGITGADYDVAYVLSAYSASMRQRGTKKLDMTAKLADLQAEMFPVTSEVKSEEQPVPTSYPIYKKETVTVVSGKTSTGSINGVPQYRYTTASRTYYVPDGEQTTSEPLEREAYKAVTVELPVYSGGKIVSTQSKTYYQISGTETITPQVEKVEYLECTIHVFDQGMILRAFKVDPEKPYDQFGITYGQAIDHMAMALKMTMYGSLENGSVPPITDAEMQAYLASLSCSPARKKLIETGMSLVGRVPYFWGGKSAAGWNEDWGTPKLVTATGSRSTGTLRPYGMDCSGYTDWVYKTAMGKSIAVGSWNQWDSTEAITAAELLPGDLGFMDKPGDVPINHVLMFAGYGADGKKLWLHCTSGTGVTFNTPSYQIKYFRRATSFDLDGGGFDDG